MGEPLSALSEPLALYVLRAAEKLREQYSLVSLLCVFIARRPFQLELSLLEMIR